MKFDPKTLEEAVELLKAICPEESHVNDRGCTVSRGDDRFDGYNAYSRYTFDFTLCRLGWKQYDTRQDFEYFGMWFHPELLMTFNYCEGDLTLVVAPDAKCFQAEMEDAAEYYGKAPATMWLLDDKGNLTGIIDSEARPTFD